MSLRLATCAALLGLCAIASADELGATLARARAAAGGPALEQLSTAHAKLAIETSGLSGTGERFEDLRTGRYVETYDLGVTRGAEGFDGTTPWTVDDNNPATANLAPAAREAAANEAYRRTLSYLTGRLPGRVSLLGERAQGEQTFTALEVVPQGGRAFELWIDRATGLVERTVERGGSDTTVTRYADYRSVEGVKLPFLIRASTGDPRYDTVTRVASLAFGEPLPDERFALPAPPPKDYGIAGDAPSTAIPFRQVNRHIYVELKLAGRPVTLACDTGGLNVISPELAKELGVSVTGNLRGTGVGESAVDIGVAKIPRVELGAAFLADQTFYVLPLDALSEAEGAPMRGLVGFEVFRRFVVELDYERARLTLHDPARFTYQGEGRPVPFVFEERTPLVEGEIDGIPGRLAIDTGSRSSLDLTAPFVEAHGLRARYAPKFSGVTGWGVGGPSRGELIRVGELRIGDYRVVGPVAKLSVQKEGSFTDRYLAANVGAGVLERFHLVFDYGNQRIYFAPNGRFAERDRYDQSGAWLNQDGDALRVVDVMAGAPAERAGLRVGERIVAIDGAPLAPGALVALRERFRSEPPGSSVRLRVVGADGAERDVVLVLAELV